MPTFDFFTVISHVTLGTLAVAMGAVALAMRKGGAHHIGAGRVFVWSMGLSSVLGAMLGALKYETLWITFHAGLLGATLAASGVVVLRIPAMKRFFSAMACVNALNAAALFALGIYAMQLPEARLFGFPAEDYLFLFGMAAIAGIGDLRMILAVAASNNRRIAQHLLRMCIGFFIAAGSAFTGPGASAFPKVIQDSGILSLPELLIIATMVYWLWKTLWRVRRTETKSTVSMRLR